MAIFSRVDRAWDENVFLKPKKLPGKQKNFQKDDNWKGFFEAI